MLHQILLRGDAEFLFESSDKMAGIGVADLVRDFGESS